MANPRNWSMDKIRFVGMDFSLAIIH